MTRLLFALTLLYLLLPACTNKRQPQPYEGNWTQVTRINNAYVIYIPCALDLRKMKVTDSAIHEVLPMEVNDSRIVSTTPVNGGYRLKGKESVYTFKWLDQQKGTAEWTIQYSPSSPEETVVFVDDDHEKDFEKVHQPESDCANNADTR
ncbi:MAG: hypothetical protein J7623_03855 [Chitinophaga sp.]|uniref:hypothetical protein n=1 Tax=Chitinophaga sp. TaxID=1869181 RepID=UPI001B04B80B|nr:hypothetical protein [Chitinophaga sp.]MBO9727757.1 hypothetical protein [Chitinophaga sp.]